MQLQSTKSQILAALKRQGRCSVDELAVHLGVAPMTVRQHLAALERDLLVQSVEERQRLGRPHFVYSLTDKGEESFPRPYDRFARQLLHEFASIDPTDLAGLAPDEKTALLFDRLADRFVTEHLPPLEALPLAKRVAAIADLLQRDGGFAEWSVSDGGFEIRDYNCLYRKLGDKTETGCRWHERVLARLLDRPVRGTCDDARAAQLCRFFVADAGAPDAAPIAATPAAYQNGAAHGAAPRPLHTSH